MKAITIQGGKVLSGTVNPSGNKNAVLPMLCAALLTNEDVTLHNVPNITDVEKMLSLFGELGCRINWDKDNSRVVLNAADLNLENYGGNLPMGMRASVLLFAPLTHRFKHVNINLSIGGCTLGIREIDPHIQTLEEIGAQITKRSDSEIEIDIDGSFTGGNLWPDYASVTATENAVMAAAVATGRTVIYNAAAEPHVQNLCEMLNSMGAQIEGIGSNRLIVNGVPQLHGTEATVIADHHEITTFLALGAMTGGEVRVTNAIPEHFPLINNAFAKLGVEIEYEGDTAIVRANQSFEPKKSFTSNFIPRIEAAPWPYFPADLLPLMIALSLKTKGITRFWNKLYEAGLFWTSELVALGATLEISDPHRLIVIGPTQLKGNDLECPSIIRATVALVMAAMAAEGTSTLTNVETIFRAHPNFGENLRRLGGEIEEIE